MATDVQSEMLPRRPVESREALRDDWVAAVEQVVSDAEAWAMEQNWSVHRGPKTITERRLGTYEVPALLIRAPAGRFVLDPITRDVVGALGKIELCVFPSYDYLMLIRTDAGWQIETNPKTIGRPWSKPTFFDVISEPAGKA
jgi:hypothetical protein